MDICMLKFLVCYLLKCLISHSEEFITQSDLAICKNGDQLFHVNLSTILYLMLKVMFYVISFFVFYIREGYVVLTDITNYNLNCTALYLAHPYNMHCI